MGTSQLTMYILDTSIIIDLERRHPETIVQLDLLLRGKGMDCAVTFISYYEFIFDLVKKNPDNADKSLRFIDTFHLLLPTRATAFLLAKKRMQLEKAGHPMPLADLFIGAQAIEHQMTLITKDKSFKFIPGLSLEILD